MPRRNDIQRVMILGSGPIKIGQAAEFDFSGSQACRALREDGYEVILVNSNPATIQNDPEMADRVYIEPLLPDVVRRILEIEKPDALLAGMGGQTALNIASELGNLRNAPHGHKYRQNPLRPKKYTMRNPSTIKVRIPIIKPGKNAQISGIPKLTEISSQGVFKA